MKIIYCPSFSGQSHMDLGKNNVNLYCQMLETQGLLQQLALHAGIHVEIPPYAKRLVRYHTALMAYDQAHPKNLFHRSIGIDSMSVAKTLMGWRDVLVMAGWNSDVKNISNRLNALAEIESFCEEEEPNLRVLLDKLMVRLDQIALGKAKLPKTYNQLELHVVCAKELLPDYLKPLFEMLEILGIGMTYGTITKDDKPEHMSIIEFTDQYKSEAWLSQLNENDYDVWLNGDNKRLDNWLHMTGKAVAGSEMVNSNPQITQMFLLAIQLFQRPLNVNTLLQYLYLPECPLPWKLATRLASVMVREGGFTNDAVLKCINGYLENEFITEEKDQSPENTAEERKEYYDAYLPFDLTNLKETASLVTESEDINLEQLKSFLQNVQSFAAKRAVRIAGVMPNDLRIAQLQDVATLVDALQEIIAPVDKMKFSTLQQWAQSLYETSNYRQYNAQVGCRTVINSPANMGSKAKNTIWCDFYGDVNASLETDFLSPGEIEKLGNCEIQLWDKNNETAYHNFMLEIPLHQTSELLTFVVCKKQGANDLPTHPLRLQLPTDIEVIDGDAEFEKLRSKDIETIDNRRDEDATAVCFDANAHPVKWRDQESFSALSVLLQNPLDYFMNYMLGFSDLGLTEIKMSLTLGNVAHETIEQLFTTYQGKNLVAEVCEAYDEAFARALSKKGALLLLPEHHLDRDRLQHQLRRCVRQLAEIIVSNHLTVVKCEQEELQDLGFDNGVMLKGFIDMLLTDAAGKEVIFDLKWTSKKDKYQKAVKDNRAVQLAIYKAMLQQHENHPDAARCAFFVMPAGHIVSADQFNDCHYEPIDVEDQSDLMQQLRAGYKERKQEISAGRIETAGSMPVEEIPYAKKQGVFPLEQVGKRLMVNGKTTTVKLKVENEYSDYDCFTL